MTCAASPWPPATVGRVSALSSSRRRLIAAVAAAAVAIAVALILVSVLGSGGTTAGRVTTAPATTSSTGAGKATAVPGAAAAERLFRGIPQRLNQLGSAKAPVTMVEFADLQCPFCRAFAAEGLPAIVREYVRPGKVKLVFSGIAFIGPDSETALRAAYAAGLQNRLWNFVDLLYRNQGAENSGWVTDGLVREIARSIPGLDVAKLFADRTSPAVEAAIQATSQQAAQAHVSQTPTFFVGRTGRTLRELPVTSLGPQAFRPTLSALLK